MSKKKVDFMCTAFRDGFQSVYGARVFTKDFMPAVAAAKEHGDGHRLVRRQGADEIEIAVILAEKGVEIGNKFVAHA